MAMIGETISVRPIQKKETYPWLLAKHYAKRLPSIMYAFGIFENKELCGVCTYGMPCVGMNNGKSIFNGFSIDTIELTRLVIENKIKNIGSFFISKTFKFLPKPCCLVSFADPNHNHHGYIYQATNWIYTGLSQKGGKDKTWEIQGKTFHGKTITAKYLEKTLTNYNNNLTLVENWKNNGGSIKEHLQKHRYIYFIGSKTQKKQMLRALKLDTLPYPKGQNKSYDADAHIETQLTMF